MNFVGISYRKLFCPRKPCYACVEKRKKGSEGDQMMLMPVVNGNQSPFQFLSSQKYFF